ncbi:MAG: hypothetical protein ABIE36_00630 [Candidatus Diapherotrites archaeon]
MGLFSRKKIIDLTEGYSFRKKSPEDVPSSEKTSTSSSGSFFDLSENSSSGSSDSSSYSSSSEQSSGSLESLNSEEKRRRLARRLKDMTDKLEELSNSIYLLQQRVEVLEKKTNINSYE